MDPRMLSPSVSVDRYMMDPYTFDVQDIDSIVTTKPRASYVRHPKPPYTYVGLAAMAIELSPSKSLFLSQIISAVAKMFPFFRSSYTGWKASVRHTLSKYDCFFKTDDTKWAVDLSKVPPTSFRRQDTAVAREGHYAFDLHKQLGVPRVMLPSDIMDTPTSKFDSSSDSSQDIVVDGSPMKPPTRIATTPKKSALPLAQFSTFRQQTTALSTPCTTDPISLLHSSYPATCSSVVPSVPNSSVPINDYQYMKKSPVWSQQDTYQPIPTSEVQTTPAMERNSCMQHLVSNPFFAGTAKDISPTMPTLSPVWNHTSVRDDNSDSSFSTTMPDLTPVWKILSQSISTDTSNEDQVSPSSPIKLTDLTRPLGASTPVSKTSVLRLPFRVTPENQTTKFLMDDILAERDGPAERPLTAKPTHSSSSSNPQTTDFIPTDATTPSASTVSTPAIDCRMLIENPTSWQQHSSQQTQQYSTAEMSQQDMHDAPGKAPKRKSAKRKQSRQSKSTIRLPSRQTDSHDSAVDNLQRVCQNYNFNYHPSLQSAGSHPSVPVSFDHVFPTASPSFYYSQQQGYINYPYNNFYNPHYLPYQPYPYMQTPQDASSHYPVMQHPYFPHAYTAQRSESQAVDLSLSREWWTQ